jgi:hypothetical protein
MKIWIDDVRPAPEGYFWCKSVNETIRFIETCEWCEYTGGVICKSFPSHIELIDIDHDAGDYARFGGDYIRLLDWLEETGRNYPIRIHTANAVGRENMRRIIERNGWKKIK